MAAVDALTEGDHFSCGALRDWKCGNARVWMGALWRFRGCFHWIAGWSCGARTCRDIGRTGLATAINNPVDAPAYVIRNIKRAIRPHSQPGGAMLGFRGRLHGSGESIRKYLALARCVASRERLEDHIVATLRIRCAIP